MVASSAMLLALRATTRLLRNLAVFIFGRRASAFRIVRLHIIASLCE